MSEFIQRSSEEETWENRREIIQEVPYQQYWTEELAKKLGEKSLEKGKDEAHETPLIPLDLGAELGTVWIKNEADLNANPTGTMKDRLAEHYATQYYGAIAQYHYPSSDMLKWINSKGSAKTIAQGPLERLSVITSGNAGRALANALESEELPPPKLLLDKHTPPEALEKLRKTRADIYLVDLSVNPFSGKSSMEDPLKPGEILKLTNNEHGSDITSSKFFEGAYPYRPLAENLFKNQPSEIYAPYGSGVLFESLVDSQIFLMKVYRPFFDAHTSIPERYVPLVQNLDKTKIFGAEPESFPTIAEMLGAPAKPFVHYTPGKLEGVRKEGQTYKSGLIQNDTGVYKVSEQEIQEAYNLLKEKGEAHGILTEPSASAGLALYLKRKKLGLVAENAKVVIINTGHGILSEKSA